MSGCRVRMGHHLAVGHLQPEPHRRQLHRPRGARVGTTCSKSKCSDGFDLRSSDKALPSDMHESRAALLGVQRHTTTPTSSSSSPSTDAAHAKLPCAEHEHEPN